MPSALARDAERLRRTVSCPVIVAGDVEAAQPGRQDERGQVRGGQGRDHRHGRQDDAQGEHRLQALTGRHHIRCPAEADAGSEQTAQGPARRCQRRLAGAVACEPRAQHAGDGAIEIGDGGNERRPGLARRICRARDRSSADGSAAQSRSCTSGDAAAAQIDVCNACRGSAWPTRTVDAPPRAIRSAPAAVSGAAAWCSGCGRLRNRRASSSTSRNAWRRQVRAITSSRSPCSPVAKSILCAIAHKAENVAPLVMLRRSHSKQSAVDDWPISAQHNFPHNTLPPGLRLHEQGDAIVFEELFDLPRTVERHRAAPLAGTTSALSAPSQEPWCFSIDCCAKRERPAQRGSPSGSDGTGTRVSVPRIEAAAAIWARPKGRRCKRAASLKARQAVRQPRRAMAALSGPARRT